MLTFDTTTTAALASAASKSAWCEIIKTNLGNPRILICKRAASGDAWATGTTFRDLDLTGVVNTDGAIISNFGISSNARVRLAADLATGVAVWRISNVAGTRWIQGTLGLVGSGADVERSANPTDRSGDDALAVRIMPPQFLPSGRGPSSPEWTSNTPKYVVFDPWEDDAFTNGEGDPDLETSFDERGLDWTASNTYLASQLGDVAWWSCTSPIKVGVHEIYPQLFRHDASCTQSGTKPLEAIWISARPVNELPGDWSTYPAMGDGTSTIYDRKNPRHSTYVVPGRFRFLNDQRIEVGKVEWPNGRPINDPSAPQDELYDPATGTHAAVEPIYASGGAQNGFRGLGPSFSTSDPGAAIYPHWNIAEPIFWENEVPAYMGKGIFAGVEADAMVPYMAKNQIGFNPLNQLLSPDSQTDNLYNPWVNGPLPLTREDHDRMLPIDPYAVTPNISSRPWVPWSTGFEYFPGNPGGQDIYPGPGGMREDRAAIAMRITRLITEPNGVRLEGEVPHQTWAWNWCKNYANLARTFVRDRNLGSIDKNESLNGDWKQHGGYYGAGVAPTSTKIDYVAMGNGAHKRRLGYTPGMTAETWINVTNCTDSTGRHPYGYQLPESAHHGYSAAAQALLAFKDARFAVLQRFYFDTAQMSRLGGSRPTTDATSYYGQRIHAWRWSDYFWTWYSSAEHPLSYTPKQMEDRFLIELEKINAEVYQPAFVNNGGAGDNTLFAQGVRRFGQGLNIVEEPGGTYGARENGGNKFWYLGLPVMMMKTSGMWDVMKAKSPGAANAMNCVIHSLATGSINWINGTDTKWSRYSDANFSNTGGHFWTSSPNLGATITPANLATSWSTVGALLPDPGLADYWHDSTGTYIGYEDPPLHNRAQWPSIHKLFFETEYPWAGLDTALAKFKQHYADRNAFALTYESPASQRSHNWVYRLASNGFVKPVEE